MYLRVLQICVHGILWLSAYYALSPIVGWFEWPDLFNALHSQIFLTYGTLLNIFMVYSYAHLALPRYFQSRDVFQFLLLNFSYLSGFVILETCIDYLYMQVLYDVFPAEYELQRSLSFPQWLETNFTMTLGFMVGANLYGFSYGWFYEQKLRGKLEEEKLRAELSALKHQINPHFLFNSLNSLYGMALVQEDEPTAKGIAQLSALMRYVLYESNETEVPLVREIDYLHNYVELQRMRLGNNTQVVLDIKGEPSHKSIAPMIFIPFIENAFKHGVSTIHDSSVQITLDIQEHAIHFEVANPILPVSKAEKQVGGIGLANVQKRLKLIYPQTHVLRFGPKNDQYHVDLTLTL